MKQTRMTVMEGLIRANGWNIGAELGVWQAALSTYLLDRFPALHLTCVDNWKKVGVYAGKDMQMAEALARDNLARHTGSVVILRMDTGAAAGHVTDRCLDFVFIDASHDTASVTADIKAWIKKVRVGGALTGHDHNMPSVREALDACLPGWEDVGAHCWFYRVQARLP